jgi:FlaA1/EpsC-like NDP-sugar epimerase
MKSLQPEWAVKMVLLSIQNSFGGEIFVPKLKSYYLKDLAKAVCENCEINVVGIRPGEKIHEEMISIYENQNYYPWTITNSIRKHVCSGARRKKW